MSNDFNPERYKGLAGFSQPKCLTEFHVSANIAYGKIVFGSGIGMEQGTEALLLHHGTDNPSDEEWSTYLDYVAKDATDIRYVLIYSEGGSPSKRQREQMDRKVYKPWCGRDVQPNIAVFTLSSGLGTVARTAITNTVIKLRASLSAQSEDKSAPIRFTSTWDEALAFVNLQGRKQTVTQAMSFIIAQLQSK